MIERGRHLVIDEKLGLLFKQKLEEILGKNRVEIADAAQFYVWNLLLHPPWEIDRKRAKLPLAIIYEQAQQRGVGSRQSMADFKHVGDICLLVAGFWWNSLARSLVDADYFIDLGSSAYDSASRANTGSSEVLEELSGCFKEVSNALIEMSIILNVAGTSDSELLRIYEMWVHTHNEALVKILAGHGIVPPHIGSKRVH